MDNRNSLAIKNSLIQRVLFAAISGSIGPIGYFAPKGMWIPISLIVLWGASSILKTNALEIRIFIRQNFIFLLLPIYGILTAAWALVPEDAAVTSLKILICILIALTINFLVPRLTEQERSLFVISVACGLFIAQLVVIVAILLSIVGPKFTWIPEFEADIFSRGAAITACLVIPLSVAIVRNRTKTLALVFTIVCLVTIMLLDNDGAKIAIIISLAVYALVVWRRFLFLPVVATTLAISLIFPAFFASSISNDFLCKTYDNMTSAAHRLMIYEYGTKKIMEKPILGWGMDASRSVPGGTRPSMIYDCAFSNLPIRDYAIGGRLPLHPHNAAIQVWLELGLIGAVLSVTLLFVILSRMRAHNTDDIGPAWIASMFVGTFLVYNISFGVWQSWLMFSMIILCAINSSLGLISPKRRELQ